MYNVKGYYDENCRGLAESTYDVDFSTLRDIAHTYASQGYVLKLENTDIGTVMIITPDSYFENFEGESPITEF